MEFCTQIATQSILNEMNKNVSSAENVLMSPISICLMLNILASGAGGKTLEQLLKFLGSNSIEDLNQKSSLMMSLLHSSSAPPKHPMGFFPTFPHNTEQKQLQQLQQQQPLFSVANAILVDKQYQLIPSFKEITETIYKAKVENVDLKFEADKVRENVNLWVEKETRGLIKEILPKTVELAPPLSLANALYFRGSWEDPFMAWKTKHKKFHILNREIIDVPFLNSYDVYRSYASLDDFKVLKLPYERGIGDDGKPLQFSMYLLLPHDTYGLQDMVKKFNSDPKLLAPKSLNNHLRKVELSRVSIPKMKFSYGVDVKELLEDQGLTLPFSVNADFSNMVNVNPVTNVYVNIMVHKSCIEVNEEGTEAAAATFARIAFGFDPDCEPTPVSTFVADHPFMFMIVEEFSNLVVSTGAVLDPQN
ncbi:hypothetical protein F8388_003132 [Cannabis sativa]|uniref:Serpin domain-containing protein n=1 Tax=Cannabis sativa TaxID=3483 RepID=A0A7J6HV43_CANSA|nr:hypothetical protein F8388_003132 [Cannabis sativa]KAF4398588.1 hypothetical protein G4B88_013677 [Cannabis sativa]